MTKKIITHKNPDLDAICSVWLFKEFDPDFEDAGVDFVYAGDTYNDEPVDSNAEIIHVDTGVGKFDHHQYQKRICAAQLVLEHLKEKHPYLKEKKALDRLVELVRKIDNFEQVTWPDAASDRYLLNVSHILNGLKMAGELDDSGLISFGSKCLQGIYTSLKIKIEAEESLGKGVEFESKWGSAIACETENDRVLKLGQKKGYVLAIRKDPEDGHIRIKARPDSKVDLTGAKRAVKKLDPEADWFLHASKKMLLNGSLRNPKIKPARISLEKIIQVLGGEVSE